MKVSQIADALLMEIEPLTVIDVCRYINTLIEDLNRKIAEFGYETVTIVANPSSTVDYVETTLSSTYTVKNVFIGSEELSRCPVSESFKKALDYRGLPFYVIEGNTLRVTYDETLPLKLRVTLKINKLEEPFTGDLETNIPDYMLNYVVYSIGAKIGAKSGNWSRQGYYKNMMDREGILIRAKYRVKYDDNWGGTI